MRNWLVHAIVKKNISPSPLKLPIHERGMYERAASIPAFQRSLYIFKKKFGYQEALFLPLKVGGYFLAGILKGKTAEEFMGS